MNLRSWVLGALVLAAASCLLWLGARWHRDRFHYYTSGADPQLADKLVGSGYELRELTSAASVRIQLLLRRPPSEDDPLLLLFPGNAERQLSTGIPLLEGLRDGHAAGAVVVSYRGFDGSTGTPNPRALAHDARAVLEYLERELGISGKRLILVGYSMGSGIALHAAAEMAQRGHAPAALVLMSPFWTLEIEPAGLFGPFLPSDRYTAEEVVPYLRSRTLVVGGAEDGALPVAQHARPLAAALGARGQYVELPHAGHADYLDDRAALARIAALIWQAQAE
jgi:pimeloyl-ACP methyl ester carboxylesterase